MPDFELENEGFGADYKDQPGRFKGSARRASSDFCERPIMFSSCDSQHLEYE
jgi:hypothetical protein